MSATVLERIAAGDATAVKECMDQFSGLVWSIARRYSDSAADAEDATQEIFLEIWKSAARFDSAQGTEAVFITTIARRRLIDRYRSRRRRPHTEVFEENDFPAEESVDDAPGLMSTEVEAARTALSRLSAEQREVLLLGIVEGMTHSEIAAATGRPLGTIKTQMRRGLRKVRELLDVKPGASDD